ncbi:MAG TPA: PaaI family thioesterase [Acidimicrobiales bacterium]
MTEPPDFAHYAERLREVRQSEPTPQRAQARRLAGAMREVVEHLVATKAPAEVLEAAAAQLEAIVGSLEGYPRGHSFEGFAESANSGDPTAFFDHSPLIGLANPLAPPLRLEAVDGRVVGEVRFGSAYEGPPGHVHGGFIAAAFDEVLGMAQSLGGRPGMTGTLTIRYRRPTPLHADLRFDAALDRTEGRKIFTSGRLFHGDALTAEAEGIFISVDFSKMAELAARRTAGGDRAV